MNIEDLIKLSDVMVEHSLGPNGGKLAFPPFYYDQSALSCLINKFQVAKLLDATTISLDLCGYNMLLRILGLPPLPIFGAKILFIM